MSKKIAFIRSIEHNGEITDQQIFKDVCLIPCLLNEKYGFDVTIVGYKVNEELLHENFKNIKFKNIRKTGNYGEDLHNFLIYNSKDIDILYLFGGYVGYVNVIDIFKKYNPIGKVYLKLDMNRFWLKRLKDSIEFGQLLKKSDLVTVEDRILQMEINKRYNCEVEYLRNGYYDFGFDYNFNFDKKRNTILTVGRLGTAQKATEILIKAFLEADLSEWNLRLVGEVQEDFYTNLLEKYKDNEKFKNKIKFLGLIKDKEALNDEYKKAKIFAMTSRLEASAHVYSEAAINGCYIVSTDVDGISDIKKYSTIVDVDDVHGISRAFEEVDKNENVIREKSKQLQEYTKNECSWDTLIGRLYLLFCVKGLI